MAAAERCSARAVLGAAEFTRFVRGRAYQLAGADQDLREDLYQGAALAVLRERTPHTLAWWKTRALWRMKTILRGERRYQIRLRKLRENRSDGSGRKDG